MRRASIQLILSSLFVASAIAGCTLIAEVDRSKIDDKTGTGGEPASTGGTPGEGGMGGDNAGGEGGEGGVGGAD
jgi:hypothetical protein